MNSFNSPGDSNTITISIWVHFLVKNKLTSENIHVLERDEKQVLLA